jgi:hypothetical protein
MAATPEPKPATELAARELLLRVGRLDRAVEPLLAALAGDAGDAASAIRQEAAKRRRQIERGRDVLARLGLPAAVTEPADAAEPQLEPAVAASRASALLVVQSAALAAIRRVARRAGDRELAATIRKRQRNTERLLDAVRERLERLVARDSGLLDGGWRALDPAIAVLQSGAERPELPAPRTEAQEASRAAMRAAAGRAPAANRPRRRPASRGPLPPAAASTGPPPRRPFAGYDELSAGEVRSRLDGLGRARLERVAEYERAHRARATVMRAVERQLAAQRGRRAG